MMKTIITYDTGILALLASGRQVSIGFPEGELSEPVGRYVYVAWIVKEGEGQGLHRFIGHQQIWFCRGATPTADLLAELNLNARSPTKVMGVWEVPSFMLATAELESEKRETKFPS